MHRRGDELEEHERCTWLKANGARCQQPREGVDARQNGSTVPGTVTNRLCRWHESMLVDRARLWQRAEHTESLSIETHLEMQLKMAYVMVRELEFQVLDLGLGLDAWMIETTETEERESIDPKNSFMSSKRAKLHGAHAVVVQYLREREHYGSIIKVCISAGIASKQLAIIERYVESLVESQMSLARALGHDPNDPTVRSAIMETIRQQQASLQDLAPSDPRALEG